MTNHDKRIQELLMRLDLLSERQDQFSREINDLRIQIDVLRASKANDAITSQQESKPKEESKPIQVQKETPKIPIDVPEERIVISEEEYLKTYNASKKTQASSKPNFSLPKSNLEKFIGENLLNKIGILITIIGVIIGVKYSIENELISPLTRIILGYLSGIGLLVFGIKLKKNYENYSAVLVSGAIAILYFITFSAYSFYDLIPQAMAFVLMVIFTVFGVVAALHYNKQIIAHIGLVGAYAVPFLLSNDSGNAAILFSYMAIINIGILVISFKKYWKSLFYSAFGFSWLIFFTWYATEYKMAQHFGLGLLFLTVFFIIFYLAILAYKLIKEEEYHSSDVILLLLNSFIFYGIGFFMLDAHEMGGQFLGAFTLINAVLHFIVSLILYKKKLADKNLFYLVSGLVLTFITIAIPVQLDGNWVTLLWVLEATLLFWIGRTKGVAIYEKLSYPLLILAFFSIIQDWMTGYQNYMYAVEDAVTPIFNIHFLSSLLFCVAFAYVTYLYYNKTYVSQVKLSKELSKIIGFTIPCILVIAVYYAFRLEIANYWNQLYDASGYVVDSLGDDVQSSHRNYDLRKFKTLWIINYTFLFLTILSYINIKKIRHELLAYINLGLIVFFIFIFLTQGFLALSELRDSYINRGLSQYYDIGIMNIGIRYICYLFLAALLLVTYKYIQQDFIKRNFSIAFDALLHITILAVLSSELIHWLDLASNAASDKLGLSILWGIYALLLITLGIWKKKKHIRIGAIVLFGITLVKLFMYDISHLTTIAKTIVFVSLGVLLLIISFLYNKYKNNIFDEA